MSECPHCRGWGRREPVWRPGRYCSHCGGTGRDPLPDHGPGCQKLEHSTSWRDGGARYLCAIDCPRTRAINREPAPARRTGRRAKPSQPTLPGL